MRFRELSVAGAWEVTPEMFTDERGVFLETFQDDAFAAAVGRRLQVRQVNTSVSAAGVVRGIHFADLPPSQAKYVSCPAGAVLDVVVDIRVGSPTFGRWDGVVLDDVDRRAVYVPEGLGHAFCSLEDDSTVVYLCSAPYAPGGEHGVHPLDESIGIDWPTVDRRGRPLDVLLSPKDARAPGLAEAADQGLLPTMAAVEAFLGAR